MSKAKERALRREIITKALTTEGGIDAAVELIDAFLANDDINDDDAAERENEAVRAFARAVGYNGDEES